MRSKLLTAYAAIAIVAGCRAEAPATRLGSGPITAGSGQSQKRSDEDGLQGDSAGAAADSAAYGGEYGIRASYGVCMSHHADALSTAGHRQDCADTELQFQDRRLNRLYRNALHALEARDASVGDKAALEQAQRAWLDETDAACAIEAEQAGSTMGPSAQSTCYMDRTAQRAHQLELQQVAPAD